MQPSGLDWIPAAAGMTGPRGPVFVW